MLLFWVLFGALIGVSAAQRRGVSVAGGIIVSIHQDGVDGISSAGMG